VEQHWSHSLPRQPGRLWDLVYAAVAPYLERGEIEQVWVGNACYMQHLPGVSGLDGMRWGIDWTRRARWPRHRLQGLRLVEPQAPHRQRRRPQARAGA
jgi:hypothetical protein